MSKRRKSRRKSSSIGSVLQIVLMLILILVLFRIIVPAGRTAAPVPTATPTAAPTPEPTAQPTPEPTPVPTATATPLPTATPTPEPTATPTPTPRALTISAAGDCTLGGDMRGSSEKTFADTIYADSDPLSYCFRNVADIFASDDLTIVNLEVVLTDSSSYLQRDDKIFIMRGKPAYVNMLTSASIEVANIANNHVTDFGDKGIEDMAALLSANGLGCCGYGYTYTAEINGLTVGFVGINTWTTKDSVKAETISSMREKCDILIVSCHWGNELEYKATEKQISIGHMAVDLGADLVLGHHPHVVNGIEVYKGVNIVYSLGNFCFGGKRNPTDKDTFIYQHTFTENADGTFTGVGTVIPCKITSVEDESYNNYQPTPVTDPEEAASILRKIEKYSSHFDQMLDLIED